MPIVVLKEKGKRHGSSEPERQTEGEGEGEGKVKVDRREARQGEGAQPLTPNDETSAEDDESHVKKRSGCNGWRISGADEDEDEDEDEGEREEPSG
ncbi:hypothetical protein EVG20_g5124 [Dentipellis fragilis]|uniref:Uncharacterized protein n=1 Tax=Dentipellis fragilis TaxID=205917 RepID=A0A4Y9YUS6_9AGAM|nr:hypothetical protein EVG20_g5124 [Dentipellis fragilis]